MDGKAVLSMATLGALLSAVAAANAQSPSNLSMAHGAAACGTVTVARLNWASAQILAAIDGIVLSEGFGCTVELVDGDTLSTLKSMVEDGTPDISPETWINTGRETLDAAVAARELHYLAPAFADGAVEGWWVPSYVIAANPDIETIADALERPDLFPSNDGGGGIIHNCPEGWSCAISTHNLFRAYQASDKGFALEAAEDGDALEASLADAYAAGRGWLGYYWAPTAALGRHDMVKLSFDAPYDEDLWHGCMVDPDCPAPRITAWPRSEVYTVVTDTFARRGNGALGYLKARSLGNAVLNDLLAWRLDNDATAEETAWHFLETEEDLWREWVGDETADAIIGHLDARN